VTKLHAGTASASESIHSSLPPPLAGRCKLPALVRTQDPQILMFLIPISLPDDRFQESSTASALHANIDVDSEFENKQSLNSSNHSLNKPCKSNNISSFSVSVANFHSVKNKQAELQTFLVTHNLNIIVGTESHLDGSIVNSEIFPSHYQVYCNDRNIHGGGGFILVDNNIPSSPVMINSPCEAVWVQIHTQNHSNIILGSFYCPPQSPVQVWDDLA